jgi:putative nucleotidyltransferase with HDIG domain
MVKRSRLTIDDSLFGDRKKVPKPQLKLPRGRADNALAVVLVLALALSVLLAVTSRKENWWAIAVIGLLFLASELFALPMRSGGRLSIALFPVVMAMMVSGAFGAALIALFGIPVFYMERGEAGARRVLFNAAQYLFAAGAAGWVFRHTGGATLDPALKNGGDLILPWVLAVLVFFVFNTVMVDLVLTPEDERIVFFWERRLLPKLPGYILYGGLGFLAVIVYVQLEFPAVVLFFAPLLVMRVVYTRYGTMRDVCDSTTLAVMEAVEGSGMFTSGHSTGVADMACAICEEMDFSEEDIHAIRQAALLHDVGRLALDQDVINKEGVLTEEEYEEIKRHPLIAADIVSKEASFAAVVPTVRHHHEMFDGSGYVDGLAGETIPIGARILTVADSFDAMQRPTGFREPMSAYDAAAEVIRTKGVQFDPDVVDAFIKVVRHMGIWDGALMDKVRIPVAREGGEPAAETDQLKMEVPGGEQAVGAVEDQGTPAEGMKYAEVRSEIEEDIREWERSDFARSRRRSRGEHRKKPSSRRRKGREEGPGGT